MGAVLNWVLAHGVELAGVALAWIAVAAVGAAAVLVGVWVLPELLTGALEQRIQRRKQCLDMRLHEGEHLAKAEALRAKLARPVEGEEAPPFPTRRV